MAVINNFINVLLLSSIGINSQARSNLDRNRLKNNVLVIMIDDLRHLMAKSVKLPNIEKMAANGIKFENAYAQQALCAPSRNSMLTSRRPDSLRLYDFYSYWRDYVGNFTTLPQLFKQNGYDTYSVGKVFHPGASSNFSDDFPYSWTYLPYHPTSEKYKDSAVCKDKISDKLQKNLICPVNVTSQPEHTLPDLQTLDYAINILQERENKSRPFLLAVGFHKPHIPLKFPQEYLDRVPLDKIHPPKHRNLPKSMPTVAWHPWMDIRRRDDIAGLNISFPFGTMPYEWTLEIIRSYYAAAIYVDDLIGSLIRHVDLKNTIVVLTSDHGWSLGENGLWAKYSNFDVALKVPLIFLIPEIKPNTILTPVELIDVFPTLADLTGLDKDIPKCTKYHEIVCFDGKSLMNLITQTENDIIEENFAISQYPRPSVYPTKNSDKPKLKNIKIMGYSIRTFKYRYTEWVSFNNTLFTKDWNKLYGLELYDHTIDPYEAHNLVSKSKYSQVRKYLSKLLRETVDNNKIESRY